MANWDNLLRLFPSKMPVLPYTHLSKIVVQEEIWWHNWFPYMTKESNGSKTKKLHFRRGLSTKFHYISLHIYTRISMAREEVFGRHSCTKRGTCEALKTENMLAVNAIPCDRGMVVWPFTSFLRKISCGLEFTRNTAFIRDSLSKFSEG